MKFLRENWSSLLTILFLIVVGILVLVNPELYTTIIIRVVGVLLTLLPPLILFLFFQKQVYAGLASGSVKG